MKKEARVTFTLSEKEIREALYDKMVSKLSANKINAFFAEENIEIETTRGSLEVSLTITEFNDNL